MDIFVKRFRTLSDVGAIAVISEPPASFARAAISISLAHENERWSRTVLSNPPTYRDLFAGCGTESYALRSDIGIGFFKRMERLEHPT